MKLFWKTLNAFQIVTRLVDSYDFFRPSIVDNVVFKSKVKRKMQANRLNEIMAAVYPFISVGMEWTM